MKTDPREVARIVISMAATCAIGAAVLGAVFMGTDRYRTSQERANERRDVTEMLALEPSAAVIEVRQFLSPERREVVYRIAPMGEEERAEELVFTLEGVLVRRSAAHAAASAVAAAAPAPDRELRPLGRTFVALENGAPAGFVVEGRANGYKNRIRFLVALARDYRIAGVRVVEHEEDPGLGAEIAKPEFEGQFVDRPASGTLDVTRDPAPEDWRKALARLQRMPLEPWRREHRALLERETRKPIYAVTGATISSRALADGVRSTAERFRSRWERIAPYLEVSR